MGGGNPEKVRLRGTRKVRAGLTLHARRTRSPEEDTAHVQMYRPAADTRLRMNMAWQAAASTVSTR
jgi:hypothetical protein